MRYYLLLFRSEDAGLEVAIYFPFHCLDLQLLSQPMICRLMYILNLHVSTYQCCMHCALMYLVRYQDVSHSAIAETNLNFIIIDQMYQIYVHHSARV